MALVIVNKRTELHLARFEDAQPGSRAVIQDAVLLLERHPLIGPCVPNSNTDRRRLVISHGKTGYVALYRYDRANDTVFILAVRHQREAGFAP